MWIDPRTQIVYRTKQDVRLARPNTSFSADMGDGEIEGIDLARVAEVARPAHNPLTQRVNELPPVNVGSVWTQRWETVDLDAEEANTNVADARVLLADRVRAIRDRKMLNGGYQHNGKWFHSDLASRIQQLGLNMAGNAIPPQTKWKTMDGTLVTMTPAVAQGIFAAAMQQDLALFERGEQLIAAINASSAPESIDITTGWPATYGGV